MYQSSGKDYSSKKIVENKRNLGHVHTSLSLHVYLQINISNSTRVELTQYIYIYIYTLLVATPEHQNAFIVKLGKVERNQRC
jgi:hypothetical protein